MEMLKITIPSLDLFSPLPGLDLGALPRGFAVDEEEARFSYSI